MALPSVTREIVELTPKMASDLLARNAGNRGLAQGRVRALAAEITRGGWAFNGQPIIVDDEGNLLDGQHRCAAVVLAKKAVRVMLVRGIPREAFATIDCGRARSGADVLTAGGTAQGHRVAAVLRLIYQYTLGVLGSASPEHRAANSDVADMMQEHPEVLDSVQAMSRLGSKHMRNAACAFMHWATTRGNPEAAHVFWSAVGNGEGQHNGSPALKFRDSLMSNADRRSKYGQAFLLEIAIRAWIHHLTGSKVTVLRDGILDAATMRNAKGDIVIPMDRESAGRVMDAGFRSVTATAASNASKRRRT